MHNNIIYCPKCEQCGQQLPFDLSYYKQSNYNPLPGGLSVINDRIVFEDKYKKCPNCGCEFDGVKISTSLFNLL